MARASLASEQVGQFFLSTARGRDRIEYTEYGAGERWVVLVPPLLVPRAFHDRLARSLAAAGLHVVVPDLLGHGRSDRPGDPLSFSVAAFAAQVLGLMDALEMRQAVVGGTGLGANVALEVAVAAPGRTRALVLDGPVLDDALTVEIAVLSPALYAAKFAPLAVHLLRTVARPVPRRMLPGRTGLLLDSLDQRPSGLRAIVQGILFGRLAPPSAERASIAAPALVIGRIGDRFHPLSDAEALVDELPVAVLERTKGLSELVRAPERIDLVISRFVLDQTKLGSGVRRTKRGGAGA